jgi:hypothetical protein
MFDRDGREKKVPENRFPPCRRESEPNMDVRHPGQGIDEGASAEFGPKAGSSILENTRL